MHTSEIHVVVYYFLRVEYVFVATFSDLVSHLQPGWKGANVYVCYPDFHH